MTRRRIWLAAALALVALLAVLGWLAASGRTIPPPEPAAIGSPDIVALGRLLPRSRILAIAPPAGAGDARIAELPISESSRVAAGEVLAVLDSASVLRAALAAAEAEVAARQAALDQTRVSVAAARQEARAALARAEAALPILRRDRDRAADLQARGAATQQTLDQRRLAYDQAVQEAARAAAQLQRQDAPDPEAQVDVLLARRTLDAALAARDRAAAELDRATVRAPAAGTVLTLHARPGERPGAAGILSFGTLDEMIAEIEVHEDQTARLRPGAQVTLDAPALSEPLRGRLATVGREVLRQTLTDPSPAAATDARVLRAVVALDAASTEVAARLVNLQVTARIAAAP
ncbi:MAG: HlyD family efflux transporter periplasmic adaptor subunit [Rubritepida sp.]|nr:HlyD family efflux transporter periplasmic adaptor subunit [Rubritepida sp.]